MICRQFGGDILVASKWSKIFYSENPNVKFIGKNENLLVDKKIDIYYRHGECPIQKSICEDLNIDYKEIFPFIKTNNDYDFQKRNTIFSELNNDNKTNIYFDRDHHLLDNLTHLSKVIGEYRKIAVCFNMTRIDQHILRGTIKEVISWLLQNGYDKPRQDAEWLLQITVVVEGNEPHRPHI